MRTIELTVSATRKVNLGNYESADVFVALKGELETRDTLDDVMEFLCIKAEQTVEREALRMSQTAADGKEQRRVTWNADHGVKDVRNGP